MSAQNESSSSSSTKHAHVSVNVSTSGAVGVNASADFTESDNVNVTNINSHLSGKNITIKSKKDTLVRGGVVAAEEALDLNVGGNLLVESVQDTSKSGSHTYGVSAGFSSSNDSNSGSGGMNYNMSKGNSRWVEEQTSLTGGKVNIYVENKTTLKGAVINSTTGDLTLDTGSFEFSNIKDKNRSSNFGGGVNAGTTGTYSANASYGYSNKQQVNLATVGEGTIIVRDGKTDVSKLNRDVEKAQYQTLDVGLEGGFTVDKSLVDHLTDPNAFVQDAKEIKKGALITYSYAEGAVKALATGAEGDLGVLGTIKAVGNSQKDVRTIVDIADNKGLALKIDKALEGDAKTLEEGVNDVSRLVQMGDGSAEGDISKITLYQGDGTNNGVNGYAACYNQNTNETFLNTLGTDISQGGDIINSIFTEAQRKDNAFNSLGLESDQQRTLAYSRGDQAENLWNRFSETASTTSDYAGRVSWNITNSSSSTLLTGNNKVNGLDSSDVVPRVIGIPGSEEVATYAVLAIGAAIGIESMKKDKKEMDAQICETVNNFSDMLKKGGEVAKALLVVDSMILLGPSTTKDLINIFPDSKSGSNVLINPNSNGLIKDNSTAFPDSNNIVKNYLQGYPVSTDIPQSIETVPNQQVVDKNANILQSKGKPVEQDTIIIDNNGNAIPVKAGQRLDTRTDDATNKWFEVKDVNGDATGNRLDDAHPKQADPKAQKPHAHRADDNKNPILDETGNPHLPINN